MDFRILGPIEVWTDDGPLPLGGTKQRALLAVLLLNANRVVSTDRLIEDLWGDDSPPTAGHMLHIYVSRLRKVLGRGSAPALETRKPGYVLRAPSEAIDARRFEVLIGDGRRAVRSGDPSLGAAKLHEALSLWRGPPLADLPYESFGRAEVARLEDLMLSATEDRIDADLALGRHAELAGELPGLVAEHPLRERLRGQLVLALYRCGRQADALQAYEDARQTLADELGIDPSPDLQRLFQAVLRQDPELGWTPPMIGVVGSPHLAPAPVEEAPTDSGPPRKRRHRAMMAGIATAAALGIVLVTVLLVTRGADLIPPPDSVARIDPATGRVVLVKGVGDQPTGIAESARTVWVASMGSRTVTRVDTATGARKALGNVGTPSEITAGEGTVWVVDSVQGQLVELDVHPDFTPINTIPDLGGPEGAVIAYGALWVTDFVDDEVLKFDPMTGHKEDEILLDAGDGPSAIAAGEGAIWVLDRPASKVTRINPRTDQVVPGASAIPLPARPIGIAAGDGFVWVTCPELVNRIVKIDPAQNAVVSQPRLPVPDAPTVIAAGSDGVWVGGSLSRSVWHLDRDGNVVGSPIRLGGKPGAIVDAGGSVWVTVEAP